MTLDSPIYDIGIIGGGITGAAIARDAALRGIRVVLFEKNTFGSGTSGHSSKLIHGGIRYLEIAWNAARRLNIAEAWKNLRFVFFSLNERRTLAKIAPDLVKPLPLVIPIYADDHRQPIMIYFGVYLYFFLALLSGGTRAPKIFWKKESLLLAVPGLKKDGLLGGVMIWDSLTDDEALVKATITSAAKRGALCFEKSQVIIYEWVTKNRYYQITVNRESETENFYCRKLINATGPWVDKTREIEKCRGGFQTRPYIFPIAGAHITLRGFTTASVIIQAMDGRIFFVISHGGHCRVGTTERAFDDPDRVEATEEEIDYLLRSVSRYFPGEYFKRADMISCDAGIRPLSASGKTDNHNAISRDHEIKIGPSGVFHIIGVKLTDHRRVAEIVVNKLVSDLRCLNPAIKKKCRTKSTILND